MWDSTSHGPPLSAVAPDASFRGRHGWRADAPAAAGGAGGGAEWSLCTGGRLGEVQGKLEVER